MQFSASAARMPISTARLFKTGSVPGKPRQTGQTLEFGGSPNRVEQPQKILVLVSNCAWTSRPITGSYFPSKAGEMADSVTNFVIGQGESIAERAFGLFTVAPITSAWIDAE